MDVLVGRNHIGSVNRGAGSEDGLVLIPGPVGELVGSELIVQAFGILLVDVLEVLLEVGESHLHLLKAGIGTLELSNVLQESALLLKSSFEDIFVGSRGVGKEARGD